MLDYGWKRLFSGLLALVLVVGMLPPVTVSAEETEPSTETAEILETVAETTEAAQPEEPEITEPVETTEAAEEPATETTEVTEPVTETMEATEPVAETTEVTEPTLPENVAAVQALIDALPGVETVTAEDYDFVQNAFDAFDALSDEEKSLIQGAEKFEALFTWFNAQIATLDTDLEWGMLDGGVMTIHGNVAIPDYASAEDTPWYEYRWEITKIIIVDGITAIGDHAFDEFCYLTSITIPESVTTIGDAAFQYCTSLTDVVIPKGVTSIGEYAFSACTSLTNVAILDGTASIGLNAFLNCTSLVRIIIPASVTNIDMQAFCCCNSLTDVYYTGTQEQWAAININTGEEGNNWLINATMHYEYTGSVIIAGGTCEYGLTWILTDTGVLTISGTGDMYNYMSHWNTPWFENYHNDITAIVICDGVTRIGNNAFRGCVKLTSVTIPEGVTRIGNNAFQSCGNLTSITIPASVTSIGTGYSDAFMDCSKLAKITVVEGNQNYASVDGVLYNIEKTEILKVPKAISGAVTIPSGITSIAGSAFQEHTNLTSLTIPASVTSIGNRAFYGCTSLTSITIPAGVTSIGSSAFQGCTGLTSVVVPVGVTSIGNSTFQGCTGLTSVTLPEGLTAIEYNAFYSCSNLTGVTIPASVTKIGSYAFYGCEKLTNVVLPRGITEVAWGTFQNCSKLESVYIPEGVTRISGEAFDRCSRLTDISIPDTVTSIGEKAFNGCNSMKIDTFPKNLTYIGEYAFFSCDCLKDIVLPEGLTRIDNYAFGGCDGLTSVTLPASITSIGSKAFYNCKKLTNVYYTGTEDQWNSITIGTDNTGLTNATIHCTDGTINERALPEIRPTEDVRLLSGQSKQFYAYDPLTNQKISVTWNVKKGADYADITADGKLTAKDVSQTQTVTIAATDSDGGTGTKTITILPKAAGVNISWVGYASFDLSESDDPKVQLAATTFPEDASDKVTWSSSNKTIATVDENGQVTLLKPGTVTITVTTTDGSNKSSSVNLTVYYVDTASKLTATADTPAIGLQPGQTAKITVTGSRELPQDKLSFSIPANQQHIATVDADTGIVTAGTTPGTVTVTAAIRNDPLKRTATVKVKVIAMQAEALELSAQTDNTAQNDVDNNMVILDAEDVSDGSYEFNVSARALTYTHEWDDSTNVTWASSNTAIATVKDNKDGTATVTIKKGASGECAITATAKDLGKASANLWLSIRDYAPRLESDSLSMNLYQTSRASVALLASYDIQIETVSVDENFDAEWKNGVLTLTAQETVKKGTYTQTLSVTCGEGETAKTYTYTLKIKVTETAPAITVKQTGKYNLFYTDETAMLTITAKDGAVNNVVVVEGDFAGKFEDGVLTLTCKNVANPNKKVTLQIDVAGYEKPVEKTVTLATVTTAPKLTLTSASSIINTNYGEQSSTFRVMNGTEVLELTENDIIYSGDFADFSVEDNAITLELKGTKGGTATLNIQKTNWTKSVKLTHKITVQDTLPTLKLGTSTLKLNSVFPELGAETTVSLSQGNLALYDVAITPKTAGAEDVLDVTFENGKIIAEIRDDSVKAGNYLYTCTGKMLNEESFEEIPLKPVTLKVTVSATTPKVKLASTTFKLNRNLAGQEEISTKVTVPAGYTLEGFDGLEDTPLSYYNGYLTATLSRYDTAGGTYTIYPIVTPEGGWDPVTLSTGLKVKVTTYSAEISATVSTKGKLDTLNPDSAITCTVKLKNCADTISRDISLSGEDKDLFHAKVQDGNVILTMVEGEDYATNKTYKVNLDMIVCGKEISKAISFKVTQSALKLTATPSNLTCYQAIGYGAATLKITSPATAQIADVALGSKTTAAFQQALGEKGLDYDPETGKVKLTLQNPGLLSPGKSYTVYLDVTPKGNATNVKPTQIKLTVKVKS